MGFKKIFFLFYRHNVYKDLRHFSDLLITQRSKTIQFGQKKKEIIYIFNVVKILCASCTSTNCFLFSLVAMPKKNFETNIYPSMVTVF